MSSAPTQQQLDAQVKPAPRRLAVVRPKAGGDIALIEAAANKPIAEPTILVESVKTKSPCKWVTLPGDCVSMERTSTFSYPFRVFGYDLFANHSTKYHRDKLSDSQLKSMIRRIKKDKEGIQFTAEQLVYELNKQFMQDFPARPNPAVKDMPALSMLEQPSYRSTPWYLSTTGMKMSGPNYDEPTSEEYVKVEIVSGQKFRPTWETHSSELKSSCDMHYRFTPFLKGYSKREAKAYPQKPPSRSYRVLKLAAALSIAAIISEVFSFTDPTLTIYALMLCAAVIAVVQTLNSNSGDYLRSDLSVYINVEMFDMVRRRNAELSRQTLHNLLNNERGFYRHPDTIHQSQKYLCDVIARMDGLSMVPPSVGANGDHCGVNSGEDGIWKTTQHPRIKFGEKFAGLAQGIRSLCLFPVTNLVNRFIPAITRENVVAGVEKRIAPTLKPKSVEYIAEYKRQADKITNKQPRVDFGCDFVGYTQRFIERKGLSKKRGDSMLEAAVNIQREIEGGAIIDDVVMREFGKTTWFPKGESYPEVKQPRFIMNPTNTLKILFGAAYEQVEHWIIHESPLKSHLIKGLNSTEVLVRVSDQMANGRTFIELDQSSMEAHVDATMLDIEFGVYESLTSATSLGGRILRAVHKAHTRERWVKGAGDTKIKVPPMRYSGMPNTSVGNAILSYVFVKAHCKITKSKMSGLMIEGDDVLAAFEDATKFDNGFAGTGFDVKSAVASDWRALSFCGLHFDNAGNKVPDIEKIKYSVSHHNCKSLISSPRRMYALARAKIDSMLAVYGTDHPDLVSLRDSIDDHFKGVRLHADTYRDYMMSIYHDFAVPRNEVVVASEQVNEKERL